MNTETDYASQLEAELEFLRKRYEMALAGTLPPYTEEELMSCKPDPRNVNWAAGDPAPLPKELFHEQD